MFADLLLERGGDPALFASLSEALARNETIGDWLGTIGPAFGLPTALDAVDAGWRAWLAALADGLAVKVSSQGSGGSGAPVALPQSVVAQMTRYANAGRGGRTQLSAPDASCQIRRVRPGAMQVSRHRR